MIPHDFLPLKMQLLGCNLLTSNMVLDEHSPVTRVSLSESRHDASLYVLVKEHAEHANMFFRIWPET